MQLRRAEVIDTRDFTLRGGFLANLGDLNSLVYVKYVTPYLGMYNTGLMAVPEVGSNILIAKTDDNDGHWYYMGGIVDPPQIAIGNPKSLIKEAGPLAHIPDPTIYEAGSSPQKVSITSPGGHKLSLSEAYNKNFFNIKAELRSTLGKKIALIDGGEGNPQKIDAIIIRNEHGDRIKLTTNPDTVSAARSIELECIGPQKLICRKSDLDLLVHDGRELNIKNTSTGINRNPTEPEKYGNINVESEYQDINITVKAFDGRVYIDALGQEGLIQIDAENRIILFSGGDLDVYAGGEINLDAAGDINIRSGGSVNINGRGGVNSEGREIHLNTPGRTTPFDAGSVNKRETNSYGN